MRERVGVWVSLPATDAVGPMRPTRRSTFSDFNISNNSSDLYNLIKNTIDNNTWEEKFNLIKDEKNKFLDNYNLVSNINNIIDNLKMND